jgi:hypothetical protein
LPLAFAPCKRKEGQKKRRAKVKYTKNNSKKTKKLKPDD